jgi:DNA-binding SARP family transcriptional activator/predicted ATPase
MEFRILGPLEVVEDGQPLPLERRRMRALLAFLLLHANQPVSADRLIDEVWGPEPPKTAGASLQNYVSRLRRAIGAETVVSQPPAYVLRIDPEQFDLARFERLTAEARRAEPRERAEKLRAALALWRGPALDDLAFEPFARDEVGRLEEARLAALEDCIDAELELGLGGDLVAELDELVEQQPLRERFHAQRMRALYRAGRQADALAAFQSAREVLTEELGLEPGEELRTLQQAILRQDPSLGSSPPQAAEERAPDRRTVTVLLCDLVGSTDLAAQLDPEAYRSLLSRYFELVREPIERHGGTLEKFIGDAVLAVFGVPELREDDALRAVRAAVEAQSALREADIAARIGLATGEVHVVSQRDEPLHVSGPPASLASKLEARAGAGRVLLSHATHALVRDAVRAEEVEGAWLVHDVVPGAPAYARRLDAPLVGRSGELERLRAAYADVLDGQCRVVTVVGEAGIGKTRLLRELVLSLREEARVLVGRCVSYGEGATYLPIAEAVRQAAPSADGIEALLEHEADGKQVARRVAELTGLAEGPAAPNEAFWAVRRFVETLAREQPLVLVLDDIHWAEPTLLDLVEYLGEWAEARVLVLCAARGELLEARPAWGGPTSTGFVVELGPLDAPEVAELLAGLSAEPDVAGRIVEQAEGNPLFAEQLLVLTAEAPELDETPRTIEALLASRLDRLGPQQLATLRRAAVIGRRFTRAELADLTPGEDAHRTEQHLTHLANRALLDPRDHVFAFHHVLVRDVAYRGIPKTERADLHERAARGVERRDGADEIVGYHFEQAHLALTEIGRADEDRARELAQAGSERLGRAGIRAWQRADAHAALNLLSRSVELSSAPTDVACELGLALYVSGEMDRAKNLLTGIADADDSRLAARARFELAHVQSVSEPNRAQELADVAAMSIRVLEVAGDDRALGRAWLSIAHARGDFFCEYAAMEEASMRAVEYYHRAGWSPSTALASFGVALYRGPRSAKEGIAALGTLQERFANDRASEANILTWLGGLKAMNGSIEEARTHILSAQQRYLELGLSTAAADSCERMLGLVEALDADLEAAELHLRKSCTMLEQAGQSQVLATRAGELARVLYQSEQYDEADNWTRKAQASSGADDLDAALAWQPVEAMLLARHGHADGAERRIRELMRKTPADALLARADGFLALAEVLRLAGRDDDARDARAAARSLYQRKGNVAAAGVLLQSEEPHEGSSSCVDDAAH